MLNTCMNLLHMLHVHAQMRTIIYSLLSNPTLEASSMPSTNFSGVLRNGECEAAMLKVVMFPIDPAIPFWTTRGIALSSSQKINVHGIECHGSYVDLPEKTAADV